jgi:hypothetical protein
MSDKGRNDETPKPLQQPSDNPEEPRALEPTESRPFKIKARRLGLPKEWTSGSVSELLEMLEGPGYH